MYKREGNLATLQSPLTNNDALPICIQREGDSKFSVIVSLAPGPPFKQVRVFTVSNGTPVNLCSGTFPPTTSEWLKRVARPYDVDQLPSANRVITVRRVHDDDDVEADWDDEDEDEDEDEDKEDDDEENDEDDEEDPRNSKTTAASTSTLKSKPEPKQAKQTKDDVKAKQATKPKARSGSEDDVDVAAGGKRQGAPQTGVPAGGGKRQREAPPLENPAARVATRRSTRK